MSPTIETKQEESPQGDANNPYYNHPERPEGFKFIGNYLPHMIDALPYDKGDVFVGETAYHPEGMTLLSRGAGFSSHRPVFVRESAYEQHRTRQMNH